MLALLRRNYLPTVVVVGRNLLENVKLVLHLFPRLFVRLMEKLSLLSA
jgi:hypothetical protein